MNKKEYRCLLRTKIGFRKQEGFQPELVCLLFWSNRPPVVNTINFCTKNNMYVLFIQILIFMYLLRLIYFLFLIEYVLVLTNHLFVLIL